MHSEYGITVSKGDKLRICCGRFHAQEVYSLEPNGYAERILEIGDCPQCGNRVVTVCKKTYTGNWIYETCKRKKAQKLFEENKSSIIGGLIKNFRTGNKSNMGFRYGDNVEIRKKDKIEHRQYAVDFNGTRELVKLA